MVRASPHLCDIAFWFAVPLHTMPPQFRHGPGKITLEMASSSTAPFPEKLKSFSNLFQSPCIFVKSQLSQLFVAPYGSMDIYHHSSPLVVVPCHPSIHWRRNERQDLHRARNAPDDDAGSASAVEPQKSSRFVLGSISAAIEGVI